MTIQQSNIDSADFFVHPDYRGVYSGVDGLTEEIKTQYNQYLEALQRCIGESALPILIYDPSIRAKNSEFWNRFAPVNRFPSSPGNGILSRDTSVHNRFNSLLEAYRVTGAVVHGSYLEACVLAFRAHLSKGNDQLLRVRHPEQKITKYTYEGPDTVQYGITLSREEPQPIPEFATSRAGQGLSVGNFAVGATIYFC